MPSDPERRAAVAATIEVVREVCGGTSGGTNGFLRPDPAPPVIVGGFGARMAELAGRLGDDIHTPVGPSLPRLLDVARTAHERAGHDPEAFIVTTSGDPDDPDLERLGVHRAISMVRPPYVTGVAQPLRVLGRR